MKRSKISFAIIAIALFANISFLRSSPVSAQTPSVWQQSAKGLKTQQNPENKTAGLGFIVQVEAHWPRLSLRGGVKNGGWQFIAGPFAIDLGSVKIPGASSVSLSSESADWSHNEMTFNGGTSTELKLWVSRLSSAILTQSAGSTLRLFAGDVTGDILGDAYPYVQPRPTGPSYPKYVAYSNNGNTVVQSLSQTTPTTLPDFDQNFLLLWYGENSHFLETKKPLSYTDNKYQGGGFTYSLTWQDAYQADTPILVVFQNQPASIKQSEEGGVDISFAGASGYVSLLPLFGRNNLKASETESWGSGLPADVAQKASWWADHLCDFPVSVSETYAYDEATDTVSIQESINFLPVCSGGTTFAPLPPMLGIAKDALGVQFSGTVVDGNLPTEFGPSLGIENTQSYTWSVAGLKKYTDAKRLVTDTGQPPAYLEQELTAQVDWIMQSGHLAPWIFMDGWTGTAKGDAYWLNPGDVLYHLTEIADALPDSQKSILIEYIEAERLNYPPEWLATLPFDRNDPKNGTFRQGFSEDYLYLYDWKNVRPDLFPTDVSLYNFFGLSRYYALTEEAVDSEVLECAKEALDREMSEHDWATFFWFKKYVTYARMTPSVVAAVIEANRHFAGLVGFVKLAKLSGDQQAEGLGRALLTKAAVLRLGIAQYPRYLYQAGLVELPPDPAWQVKMTSVSLTRRGHLFNYDWTGPDDDARQVVLLDQFEVYLYDHSGIGSNVGSNPMDRRVTYLVAYRDMVPELGRLLADHAKADSEIYLKKVEALFPHWYASFRATVFGLEHDLIYPIDAFESFMAKVFIQQEGPDRLTRYVDIPWVEGDLFYVHKLAEAVKAYRGVAWDCASALEGDLNCDCRVDIVDIMLVANLWNSRLGDPGYDARYDLNQSGNIDIVDIMLVATRWGDSC